MNDESSRDRLLVTVPTHPLYGKSFNIVSLPRDKKKHSFALVQYKGHMALKIPLEFTNLSPRENTHHFQSKLTIVAINELLLITKEQEEQLCQLRQEKSGKSCQTEKKKR